MNACSQTATQRGELKYVLDEPRYHLFRDLAESYLEPDFFACTSVCSLYLDTPDNTLVRRSLEKPPYKEKFRLRAYRADSSSEDGCFLEIKKKMKGTVYKRRVSMTLVEALAFYKRRKYPLKTLAVLPHEERDRAIRILKEMEGLYSRYGGLNPTFTVSCKRLSLKERDTDSLRLTFDRDLRWSYQDGRSIPGIAEHVLINPETRIMEIKSTAGLPFWLVGILNFLQVYPQPFSKVGKSYGAWLQMKGR